MSMTKKERILLPTKSTETKPENTYSKSLQVTKQPGGRPTKFRKEFVGFAYDLCAYYGMTDADLASKVFRIEE